MRLFDAIEASPVGCATRADTDEFVRVRTHESGDPNVALNDKGLVKAFRTHGDFAWQRRSIREAAHFEDWEPAKNRLAPTRWTLEWGGEGPCPRH